jgi:hypothetical protein
MKTLKILIIATILLSSLFINYFSNFEVFKYIAFSGYWGFILLSIFEIFFSTVFKYVPKHKELIEKIKNNPKNKIILPLQIISVVSLIYCNWIYTGITLLTVVVVGLINRQYILKY